MSNQSCENCRKSIPREKRICPNCGYPQLGSKQEKIAYNTRLFKVRDLIEESDKSIQVIFSFSIIFFVMGAVVLAFSLIFGQNDYAVGLFFVVAGKVYYLLNRIGRKSAYLMILLAFFFYTTHTIFEFSYGIYPQCPVDINESFARSKGAAIVYYLIPLIYILLRLTLIIVLIKYLYTQVRLRNNIKMMQFVRSEQQK
jgi:hypothetical protein